MNIRILHYDTIDSTNTEAARQARQGADEGLCIVADQQTGGKGRQGRSWISAKGRGVYLSIVLRPTLGPKFLSLITLAAAVAVYDLLLKGFLIQPDIKWPNDILVNSKKICGILAEAIETNSGLAIILGIGINISTPEQENATSIEAESDFPVDRDEIVRIVIEDVAKLYDVLHTDPPSIVSMWTERSSYSDGMPVEVTTAGTVLRGTTASIDVTGALRLRLADGSTTTIHAGDVTRLRQQQD
jgi:BirA family biotin operon repressor/biotin-[acetyl-CoA-carboxylase] ligase